MYTMAKYDMRSTTSPTSLCWDSNRAQNIIVIYPFSLHEKMFHKSSIEAFNLVRPAQLNFMSHVSDNEFLNAKVRAPVAKHSD